MSFSSSDINKSRRSPILSSSGMIASCQPLASITGAEVLRQGGNALDAALAALGVLFVTQPCSAGLGGDIFCLYYSKRDGKVFGLNGSGRSPKALTLELCEKAGFVNELPDYHPFTVTVPGAPAAIIDLLTRFGSIPISTLLNPAIDFAYRGFPVAPITTQWWKQGAENALSSHHQSSDFFLVDGRPPLPGEIIKQPQLAKSLETLVEEGEAPFYTGVLAESISGAVNRVGGLLEIEDLASHESSWIDPLSIAFRERRIWQCPPNSCGLVTLLAINIIEHLKDAYHFSNELDRIHMIIESLRMSFFHCTPLIADERYIQQPIENVLSVEFAEALADEISLDQRLRLSSTSMSYNQGDGDTVYLCVVDNEGNACSLIASNYMDFGSGIVPAECGYAIQNRGRTFRLEDSHANCVGPSKRPYHTIMPGIATWDVDDSFYSVFGLLGGHMQPQAHLQFIISLIEDDLEPQAVLDMPRLQLLDGQPDGKILIEDGFGVDLENDLHSRGHKVKIVQGVDRTRFGVGQMIIKDNAGVLWGASDPRGDGIAIGII